MGDAQVRRLALGRRWSASRRSRSAAARRSRRVVGGGATAEGDVDRVNGRTPSSKGDARNMAVQAVPRRGPTGRRGGDVPPDPVGPIVHIGQFSGSPSPAWNRPSAPRPTKLKAWVTIG